MPIRWIHGRGMFANAFISGSVLVDAGVLPMAVEPYRDEIAVIVLTHGHYDHTGAVYAEHEETGAPVYMNALDAGTAVAFDSYTFTPPEGTIFYKEGDEVKVGNLTFRVMETPGHTPGGVTLICGDALFTGDTLFAGSCGRTDFAGGSMEVELQSLAKIAALPGDYEVYPGHMDCSTLETERRFNPYLTALKNRGQ